MKHLLYLSLFIGALSNGLSQTTHVKVSTHLGGHTEMAYELMKVSEENLPWYANIYINGVVIPGLMHEVGHVLEVKGHDGDYDAHLGLDGGSVQIFPDELTPAMRMDFFGAGLKAEQLLMDLSKEEINRKGVNFTNVLTLFRTKMQFIRTKMGYKSRDVKEFLFDRPESKDKLDIAVWTQILDPILYTIIADDKLEILPSISTYLNQHGVDNYYEIHSSYKDLLVRSLYFRDAHLVKGFGGSADLPGISDYWWGGIQFDYWEVQTDDESKHSISVEVSGKLSENQTISVEIGHKKQGVIRAKPFKGGAFGSIGFNINF